MEYAELTALIRAEVRALTGAGAQTGFGDGGLLIGGINAGVNGGCRDQLVMPPTVDAVSEAKLYDITALSTTVTVTRCMYMRGPLTVTPDDPATYTPTGTGEITLCLKINTQAGTVELSQTPDTGSLPDSSEFVNVPLYVLTRADGADPWTIVYESRPGLIQLPVYT